MSKVLRLFTVSLLLASIMIATLAGAAFADRNCHDDYGNAPESAVQDRDRDCWQILDPYSYQGGEQQGLSSRTTEQLEK